MPGPLTPDDEPEETAESIALGREDGIARLGRLIEVLFPPRTNRIVALSGSPAHMALLRQNYRDN
jgi:hypothetical protein